MVKMTIGVTTTALVGKHFETTGSVTRTYYYAGSLRFATREGRTVWWIFSDHLGSIAVTATGAGDYQAELRYRAFGLTRLKAGTQKTPYRYTGQRIEGGTDLYHYGARWYDPVVGRFLQADTIVPQPGNPQALNRYTYVGNNPLRYTDPTGHFLLPIIAVGGAGGAIGGAIYGYGVQVSDNLQRGKSLGQALTTDIDPGKVALYAGTGAVLGSGIGLVGGGAAAILAPAATSATAASVATAATTATTAACADGNPTNEVTAAASSAARFVTGTASQLDKIRTQGQEVHHLVEQRFARGLGLVKSQMQSVILEPGQHQKFTNFWRTQIGYNNSGNPLKTGSAKWQDIWDAAERIYADSPELWQLVRDELLSVKP